MASPNQQARDLANNTALFAAGQAALALGHKNRPKNTTYQYNPKIKEWEVRS